jgi:hypothetical protein
MEISNPYVADEWIQALSLQYKADKYEERS